MPNASADLQTRYTVSPTCRCVARGVEVCLTGTSSDLGHGVAGAPARPLVCVVGRRQAAGALAELAAKVP